MSTFRENDLNVAWGWGFTLRDQMVIEALDETTRAVVERYVRKFTPEAETAGSEVVSLEDAYREGFEDGVQEASDAAGSASCYRVPKQFAKKKVSA